MLRKDVNALVEAIRVWRGTTGDPDSATKACDRIVEQAGVEYTWEWFLIDPSRPWAAAVPALVRERIEAGLDRHGKDAVAHAKGRAYENERLPEPGTTK